MSAQLSQNLLLTVPLAPLAGSIVAGLFGKAVGRRGAHWVTILGVLVSFIVSAMVLKSVALDGARFNATVYEWMNVGDLKMEVGFLIDGLTAMMMCVVTFVSLMVHIYTIGYMEEDPGYQRFFSYISLFTFSMLMLVMSNNFLQLFFGWEAVGLVSYLLIGFWFKKPTAIFANLKAFLVNRAGAGEILALGEHLAVVQRSRVGQHQADAEDEAEIADAVDEEGLEVGEDGGRLLEPEADQQIRHQAHSFPAEEQLQEVVAHDEHEHREGEQRDVGEEALVARVFLHVADGVDVHHQRHEADHACLLYTSPSPRD